MRYLTYSKGSGRAIGRARDESNVTITKFGGHTHVHSNQSGHMCLKTPTPSLGATLDFHQTRNTDQRTLSLPHNIFTQGEYFQEDKLKTEKK